MPTMDPPPDLTDLIQSDVIEYLYDADNDDDRPTVVRVSIHPEHGISLDDDGNPILMSYWFGTIKGIFIQPHNTQQIVWVEIQWFYCHADLRTLHRRLLDTLLEYELVNSDHRSVIDIHCIEVEQKLAITACFLIHPVLRKPLVLSV
ncbi:hypothetical protein BKA82DRAFT_11116 [Pisolithus tinctorius]|uniref:Uncharacterized protein n=1 Tax=Pisolithus tinctorius Marx 270 TaxID=870435 RepID=A0A0C3NJF2_PISTI|nr:hypothetical protein BKA82DRAFT_11116 [Pisolithus tinctorius]KIN95508.1 hypothetical protein M404DRAFT_11116 [Pisolithus tinctorius Marx 270]